MLSMSLAAEVAVAVAVAIGMLPKSRHFETSAWLCSNTVESLSSSTSFHFPHRCYHCRCHYHYHYQASRHQLGNGVEFSIGGLHCKEN